MYANHPHTTEQAIPKGKSRKDKRYVSIVPGTYAGNKRNLTTDELAAQLGLNPQSIRRRYSQTGSYFSCVRSNYPIAVCYGRPTRSNN